MKPKSRPQYYRIRRVLEMVRQGTQSGYLANSSDFGKELEVSRRTVARDLDFLRDEENAPIEYDESRKGYLLTDQSYSLPPIQLSRKETDENNIGAYIYEAEACWLKGTKGCTSYPQNPTLSLPYDRVSTSPAKSQYVGDILTWKCYTKDSNNNKQIISFGINFP